MGRNTWLLVLAALALPGCAPSAPRTPTAGAQEPAPFSPDQDVPLLAPDEAAASTAHQRLAVTKRIGGGPDDTSVDGKRRGSATPASPRAASTGTTLPRARAYVARGTGASSPSSTTGTPNFSAPGGGAIPAVGGSYPAIPSYGGVPTR